MNRPLSVGLLVVGIILLILGFNASESVASEFSEFFSGTPTNRAVWFLVGGALLTVVGLVGLARGKST